jgi:hypothetical protein
MTSSIYCRSIVLVYLFISLQLLHLKFRGVSSRGIGPVNGSREGDGARKVFYLVAETTATNQMWRPQRTPGRRNTVIIQKA